MPIDSWPLVTNILRAYREQGSSPRQARELRSDFSENGMSEGTSLK